MRSDGGVLYTQIESLLPQFVQQKHPQSNIRVQHIEFVLQRVVSGLQCVVLTFEP